MKDFKEFLVESSDWKKQSIPFEFNGEHYKAKGILTQKDVVVKFKKDDGESRTYLWHGEFSEVNTLPALKKAFGVYDKNPAKKIAQTEIDDGFVGSNFTRTELDKNGKVFLGVVDTPKKLINSVVLKESALTLTGSKKNKLSKMKIKDYMVKKYPNDPFCKKINNDVTFADMFYSIGAGDDSYKTMGYKGANSSTLLDKIFDALADEMGVSPKVIRDYSKENFVPSWGLD